MPRKKKKEDLKEEELQSTGEEGELNGEEKEKLGSKLVLVFVTLLIIVIWLGIIALLIKTDVGGFGSSVLAPMLKDVPYVNKILPDSVQEEMSTEPQDTEHMYESIDDAVAQIKELEKQLDKANATIEKDKDSIASLQGQIQDLSVYKEEQAAFEEEKEKFYEEVVFSDEAPDIEEYKTFYEQIEPENAEVLYKQVVEQLAYDEEVEDYTETYSTMKAKQAAAIFDTMTDNLGLVADILMNMESQARADILGQMNPDTAAKLTQIMEPDNK